MANHTLQYILNYIILFLAIKIFIKDGIFTKPNHQISFIGPDHKNASQIKEKEKQNMNCIYNYSSPIYNISKENCTSLGQKTWALMHSIAASYPLKPTNSEMIDIEYFFNGLLHFYPSKKMKKIVENNSIENGNREQLVKYFCYIHNSMNKLLKKKKYNCYHAADIWGGDCGCNIAENTKDDNLNK